MDNVYVGLEQGMNGDASGVRVEIELAPNLNLEGVSTPQGSEVDVYKRQIECPRCQYAARA